MAKKVAQIRFTQKQIEHVDDLNGQTDLNRNEFVRLAADYLILQIRENGYKSTLIP